MERARDEWLVIRCQLGEEEAFRELVEGMERKLYYYLRKFLGSDEEAADVLQEVWMDAFRKIRNLRNPANLRSWLYRLSHDKAVSRFRGRHLELASVGEPLDESQMAAAEPEWEPLDARRIHGALDRLSLPHREVLVLYFMEEMSYEEIAEAASIPMGLVKSRLHYAKKALRTILDGPDLEVTRA